MTPSVRLVRPAHPRVHTSESGYAMLLVFAMAAMIAIGLYQQLPRAAFEAQREKENLLIDHGEQYKRGIQLYYRKFSRYPAKIEDLDNTQNVRFLRKHFIDPMTGKDEWRLVHMGPNGQLLDSKVETQKKEEEWNNKSITEYKGIGQDNAPGQEGVNLATRKRPSDENAANAPAGGGSTPAPLAMNLPNGGNPQQPGNPNGVANNGLPVPGGLPNQRFVIGPNGQLVPAGNNPNQIPGQFGNAGNNQPGSQSSVSGNGGYGSSVTGNGGYGTPTNNVNPAGNRGYANNTGVNGMPNPTSANGASSTYFQGQSPQSNYSTNPGSNMQNNSGFGQQGQQVSPAQLINGLLTSPRPGGPPPGVNAMGTPNGGVGGAVMGGLAGVASNYKGHGVHLYNDQDEYQKWEFYYDLTKDITAQGNRQGALPGQQTTGQQTTGQQTNPNVPTPPVTPFTGGFGGGAGASPQTGSFGSGPAGANTPFGNR